MINLILLLLLFNDSLALMHKSRIETSYEDHKDIFSDFFVDNAWQFCFYKRQQIKLERLYSKINAYYKSSLAG